MASFLGGLGQGLGQIGLGVSRGELAGSAQQQRLHQQRAMELYRQGLLDQQKQKSADTATSAAARLKQMKQAPYQHSLANAELWGFYHAPENAHILAEHMARAGYTGIDPDSLPPDPNFDPVTGALKPPTAGGSPGAGAGPSGTPSAPPFAVQNKLPGGADAALPQNYDTGGGYTGPQSQPAPFDFAPPSESPFTLGQAGLAGPRSYNTPFDTAPSTQIQQPPQMPAVFPGEPAGGLPPYAPEPPAPGAEPTPGAPPAPTEPPPYDPSALLAQRRREGPKPGQTPKQFKDEMAGYARDAGLGVRQGLAPHQANFYDATAAERVMQGTRTAQQIKQEPEKFASEQAHRAAQTSLAGAQEGQIRALTPERVNQIRSTITHQRNEEQIAAHNAARADAQYRENVRHNTATEAEAKARDQSMTAYRSVATARLQTLLDNGDAFKMSPQDKAALQQQSRVYFAMHTDPLTGTINYQFDDNMRRSALQAMNGVLGKYKQAPIEDPLGGGTTNAATPTGTLGPKHGSVGGAAPAGGMSPPTMREKSALKQMLGSPGGVHGWLQKATPDQAARVRHVFQSVFPGKSL